MGSSIQHANKSLFEHQISVLENKESRTKPTAPSITQSESEDWLLIVGGIAMESCSTRRELLSVAMRAPDDYTFGIAFGKIVDILALKKAKACAAHPIVFEKGALCDIERSLQNAVFDRAIGLERGAETTDPIGYEALTYLYSREDQKVLKKQIKNAKNEFLKGQLTSWLSTNQIKIRANSVYVVG